MPLPLKECIPWKQAHIRPGEKYEEEGTAEIAELHTGQRSYPPLPVGGKAHEGRTKEQSQQQERERRKMIRFLSHYPTLFLIGSKLTTPEFVLSMITSVKRTPCLHFNLWAS